MAVTAWKSSPNCYSSNSNAGISAWDDADYNFDGVSPTALQSADGNHAAVYLDQGWLSEYLVANSFGFTTADIPSGSTIQGCEIRYRIFKNPAATTIFSDVSVIKLSAVGTVATDPIGGDWPDAETAYVWGGPTYKGGLSISDAEARSANAGCVIQVFEADPGPGDYTAYVSQVEMRWYFTAPPSSQSVTVAGISAVGALGTPKITRYSMVSGQAAGTAPGNLSVVRYSAVSGQAGDTGIGSPSAQQISAVDGISTVGALGSPYSVLSGSVGAIGDVGELGAPAGSRAAYVAAIASGALGDPSAAIFMDAQEATVTGIASGPMGTIRAGGPPEPMKSEALVTIQSGIGITIRA